VHESSFQQRHLKVETLISVYCFDEQVRLFEAQDTGLWNPEVSDTSELPYTVEAGTKVPSLPYQRAAQNTTSGTE